LKDPPAKRDGVVYVEAPFEPLLQLAELWLPALTQIAGSPQRPRSGLDGLDPAWFRITDWSIKNVFAVACDVGDSDIEFPVSPMIADFLKIGMNRTGGFFSPSLSVRALSRELGALGKDIRNAIGSVDLGDFLLRGDDPTKGLFGAKLFGFLQLSDLLGQINLSELKDKIPLLQSVNLDGPPRIQTRYCWKATGILKKDTPILKAADNTELEMCVEITARLDPGLQPEIRTTGKLTKFSLALPFVRVNFDSISFESVNGSKPSVDPKLSSVEFTEAVSFLSSLASALGFGNGLKIDVGVDHLLAGMSFHLPSIGAGVFSLQNISFEAQLRLPFVHSDDPTLLKFGFGSASNPFLLTIGIFGGGGFVEMALGSDRIVGFGVALEFGGAAAISLAVAEGSVYVMGGIYYRLIEGKPYLEGFLRCGGTLEILGLLTVSLEYGMALAWDGGVVRGSAWLTVKVELLFFEEEVHFKVERTFSGGSSPALTGMALGGPARIGAPAAPPVSILDLMDAGAWDDYWNAFAPGAA
jgi:hypothetical protein